ncbi:tetratricopeptide repeat protein [Phenylobacterium sp.]|uniref:tetratricopeptide repeat protein n=1 Tax=Phenylobacterium sp. TaxID=1871053 RepID=UPI0012128B91|nr:tetratricopeptide repeat protein [Phenylobacterium sp.]THD64811.1 MAG: tetratricopeptide repeat protein [Phenylobacterium sp.]
MEFKSGPIKFQVGARPRDAAADRAQLQAIQAKLTADDLEGAVALAETALAGGLEHPMTFNLAAGKLEAEDRYEEAVALLQRGHRAWPQDLGLRQALALSLVRLQRFELAMPHFDALIAAQPDFAPAHAARGAVLEALNYHEAAEAAFRRAHELQPQNLLAISGLASAAIRGGRYDEARDYAGQVLAAEPGYPEATIVLARADLAEGLYDAGEARLAALIADPRTAETQRDFARNLLGDFAQERARKFDA